MTDYSSIRYSSKGSGGSIASVGESPITFPFRPPPIPPPEEFPGCTCVAECTCRYESLQYITPEGLFAPFAPPNIMKPPRVCVWMHISREDTRRLEESNFSRQTAFSIFERRFAVPNERGKDMLWELLYEALRYSRVNGFSPKQTSSLLSIYYITHEYYVSSLWRVPDDTYAYFKECILLHTVQRPPKSAEILEPVQSYFILKHFINTYLRQLPLVDVACLPQYRLQLIWPLMSSSAASTPVKDDDDSVVGTPRKQQSSHTARTSITHVPSGEMVATN